MLLDMEMTPPGFRTYLDAILLVRTKRQVWATYVTKTYPDVVREQKKRLRPPACVLNKLQL